MVSSVFSVQMVISLIFSCTLAVSVVVVIRVSVFFELSGLSELLWLPGLSRCVGLPGLSGWLGLSGQSRFLLSTTSCYKNNCGD